MRQSQLVDEDRPQGEARGVDLSFVGAGPWASKAALKRSLK